jgi:UDPglucose 6-dehydrogenase
MVRHDVYTTLDLAQLAALMRTPVLVDGRNLFSCEKARNAGFTYRCLGVGDATMEA